MSTFNFSIQTAPPKRYIAKLICNITNTRPGQSTGKHHSKLSHCLHRRMCSGNHRIKEALMRIYKTYFYKGIMLRLG